MSNQKIGTDEWVAGYQNRLSKRSGLLGSVELFARRIPFWGWLVIMVGIAVSVPILTTNEYIIRVVGTIALMATLAIGLNVVVGYAGLLDLGFIAFYGIGGYAFAYMSSDFTGLHWPTWVTLPLITLLAAAFGLLLGSPSLRLVGDYLAIVTLGFGQIFVQLMTSMTRVNLPGLADPIDLTGGPNGIVNLDPLRIGGFTTTTVVDYYFVLLIVLVLVLVVVYNLNKSRLGRAWRAQREDELAAEIMGMPTRRLKLLAFAAGAAIAGLSGALFSAWQGSVFPGNFDVTQLITLYAVVVLGGMGSLPGMVIGAIIMTGVPEILRDPALAGLLFYIGVVITMLALLKPRWQTPVIVVGVGILGTILKLLAGASVGVIPSSNSPVVEAIRSWLIVPENFTLAGNWGFFVLIVLVLAATRIRNLYGRLTLLIPTVYLLIFVWETRLSQEPSITRQIFVGVLLVVLMVFRPNGLLGQKRVEVV